MAGGIQRTSPELYITTLGLYDTSYLPSALQWKKRVNIRIGHKRISSEQPELKTGSQ